VKYKLAFTSLVVLLGMLVCVPCSWAALDPDDYADGMKLAFGGYTNSTPLTNFPAAVRLDTSISSFSYDNFTSTNGYDLRFTAADGETVIPHEIEHWNTGGTSVVWVQVPVLTSDAVIYARWGNADHTTPAPYTTNGSAWTEGFAGVWHMNDVLTDEASGGKNLDSTAAARDGNQFGNSRTDGVLGGCQNFDGDDYIQIPHHSDLNGGVFSACFWAKRASGNGHAAPISSRKNVPQGGYIVYSQGGVWQFWTGPGWDQLNPVANTLGQWEHITITFDGTTKRMYKDGSLVGAKVPASFNVNDTFDLRIAAGQNESGPNFRFPGTIDEVRVSNVVRSDDWVWATAENQRSGSTLMTYSVLLDPVDYDQRLKIEFTAYDKSTPLTNFPAMVKLGNAIPGFLYDSFASGDGYDLRITADDGVTVIPHELDTWDPPGDSVVWVRVPVLTNGAVVWAYWGNAAHTTEPEYTVNGNTWSEGYEAVWHMGGATAKDSSPTLHDGSLSGPTSVSSEIGNAFSFDGNDSIIFSHHDNYDFQSAMTIEAYVNTDSAGSYQHLVNRGAGGDVNIGCAFHDTKMYSRNYISGALLNRYGSSTLTSGTWNHYTWRYDGANYGYLLNGGIETQEVYAGSVDLAANTTFLVGREMGFGNYFRGDMDEVRVSSVARSDDWLYAAWQNLASNDVFVTYSTAIANDDATAIAADSATLNGVLGLTEGLSTTVKVFWGTSDGGASAGGWDHTNTVGIYATTQAVQYAASGLAARQTYYYRFYATNANGEAWAASPMTFVTLPTDAGGIALWYAADTLAASDGDGVGVWRDISGNGRHATQSSGGAAPQYVASAVNGKPALRFDGSNDLMPFDGSFLAGTDYTVLVVEGRRSAKISNYFMGGTGAAANQNLHLGYRTDTALTHDQYANGYDMTVPGYSSQEFKLHIFVHDDGAGKRTYTNAVLAGTSANATALTSYAGAALGAARSGAPVYFDGDLVEIMVFTRALNLGEMNSLGAYLGDKYGISTAYVDDITPGDFTYRMRITFDGYAGGTTLSNFPAMVKLDEVSSTFQYDQMALPDGGDLRFTDETGTYLLNHQIDTWNTNGGSFVWVRVPELTASTVIWAYWGNGAAGSLPANFGEGVWDTDYHGVWHLSDDDNDATEYGNDGTNAGAETNLGAIGYSRLFDGTDQITCGTDSSLNGTAALTIEAWINPNYTSGDRGIGGKVGAYQYKQLNSGLRFTTPGIRDHNSAGGILSSAEFQHVVATFTANTSGGCRFYRNGSFVSAVDSTGINSGAGQQFLIGNLQWPNQWFVGSIDELRMSRGVRSDDWLQATHDQVASHSTFATYDTMVTADAATNITSSSADLVGTVQFTAGGGNPTVTLYYGTSDGGPAEGGWSVTNGLGALSGEFTEPVGSLAEATTYYFRFHASNTAAQVWSDVMTFRTLIDGIDGIELWLDADEIAGLSDGNGVGRWNDLSGKGRHAVQAVTGYRPTYTASALNSKPAVTFATDQTMGLLSSAAADGSTVFIIHKQSALQTAWTTVLGGNLHTTDNAQEWVLEKAGGGIGIGPTYPSTNYSVNVMQLTSANYRLWCNGTPQGYSGNATALDPFDAVGDLFLGDVVEVIVFGRQLTMPEQNRIGYYLADKYGIDSGYEQAFSAGRYAHSLDFTFDNYAGGVPLTNFPVLIKFDEGALNNFLYSQLASTNGWDLRATMQGGSTLLSHEIEDWNTGGVSYVWVRIPEFTNNTTITAYWGDPSDADREIFFSAAGDTWDETFRGVWHLTESDFPYGDSTGDGRNGTTGTKPVRMSSGLVGPGQNFSGANYKIDVPYDSALNPPEYSVSFWARVDGSAGSYRSPVTSRRGDGYGYICYANNGNVWQHWQGRAGGWNSVNGPGVTIGQTVHCTMTYDGSQMRYYVNGTAYGPTASAYGINNQYPLRIGAGGTEGGGNYWFDGPVDEVRVATAVRSEAWHDACYANVSDYANFVNAGDVQGPAPYIRNDMATLVIDTNATANATLNATGGVPTSVWLHWDTNYHATSGWENTNALGVTGNGAVPVLLTNLVKKTTHYYAFFASNVFGTTWAQPTTNFTTLDTFYEIAPGSGPNGSIDPSLTQYVEEGSNSVVFTFDADYGYHLTNLLVDTVLIGVTNQYQFLNVMGDHSITSYFGINYYDITVTAGVGGTITPSSPPQVVHGGDSATFAISPNEGYYLNDVLVDGVSQGPIGSYQFTNVTTNREIEAEFVAYPLGSFPTNGMVLWLRSDRVDVNDGDPVSQWYDLSGLSNHVTQSTPANQPVLETNIVNAHPVVSFNDTHTLSTTGLNGQWPTTSASVFLVTKVDNTLDNNWLLDTSPYDVADAMRIYLPWANTAYWDFGDRNNGGRINVAHDGGTAFNIWHMRVEGGVGMRFSRNGTVKQSGSSSSTFDPTGNSLVIGSSMIGDIAEVIIYEGALGAIDENRVGYYLQGRYGLATEYVDPTLADLGLAMAQAYVGDTVETANGTALYQGGAVQYTLTVTNSGPTNASGVVVTDLLPAGLSYSSHSGGAYVPGSGQWAIGDLAYQGSTTLVLNATLDGGVGATTITNSASVTANEGDSDSGNNAASQVCRSWYDDVSQGDYAHRLKIAFPGYTRAGVTLTNFPALVKLNTSISGFDYSGFESSMGADLRFTEADGTTVVAHEIEDWNTSGDSIVWVRLPELQVGTYIWAYWGNAAAAAAESSSTPTNVSGCVLWLKADAGVQTSGAAVTDWLDQSGSGNHVSQSNAAMQPTLVSAVAELDNNPAVRFADAGDDGVGLGPANLGIGATDDRTVIMVVMPDSGFTQGSEVIGSDTSHMLDFGSFIASHRLRVRNGAVNAYSGQNNGANSVRYDRPHILAVVGSGGGTVLNSWNGGERMNWDDSTTAFQWAMTSLNVGLCSDVPNRSYEGDMAELIVYDRALSRTELNRVGMYLTAKYGIKTSHNAPAYTYDGTVWAPHHTGVWHMDGTTLVDSGSRDAMGRPNLPVPTSGQVGEAQSYGGNSQIHCGNRCSITGNDSFTVSAWVNTSLLSLQRVFQQRNGGYNGEFMFNLDGSGQVNFQIYRDGWGFSFSGGSVVADGNWHFVTGIREGSKGTIYVDGVKDGEQDPGGGTRWLDANISCGIGRDIRDNNFPFNGMIDEVRLANTVHSTNWLWASYRNIASNATFLGFDKVQSAPTIENLGATFVSRTNAQFNADLTSTGGLQTAVWLFWDTTDHGTTKSAWGNTNAFPGYQLVGQVYTNLYTLAVDTTYHYAFYASNSYGDAWAQPSTNFKTAAANEFAISASAVGGGSINPSGVEFVTLGNDSSTYSFTADPGYRLTNVVVDGGSVGTPGNHQFTNVSDDHTIVAQFGLDSYAITVTQVTGGTITPDPAAAVLHGGDSEVFTITTAAGYYLVNLVVDGANMGQQFSYQFTGVTNAHTITAAFAAKPALPVTSGLDFWVAADTVTATNGQPIDLWIDLSGSGRDGSQPTVSLRPMYTNAMTALNGKPALVYDGADDHTLFDGSFLAGTDYTVIFVEGRRDANSSYVINGSAPVSHNNLHVGYRNNTTLTHAHWGNDYDMGIVGFSTQAFNVHTYWLQSGTGRRTWVNGGRLAVNGTSTYLGSFNGAAIGANPAVGGHFTGEIPEVIIYSRALSDAERAQVYAYLDDRYDLELLPDNPLPEGVNDPQLWVSADDITGLNNGEVVTKWHDMSGRNRHMTSAGGNMEFRTEQLNGRPSVFFDGGSNDYFSFSNLGNVRTVFWMIREVGSPAGTDPRFLLGHSGSYDFHRASAGGDIWSSAHAPLCFNGTTKLRGVVIDGRTTDMPTDYSIISVRTSGNASANSFVKDRTDTDRGWHGDLCELIIYSRVLSDAEESEVGNYLLDKYGLRPSLFIVR